MFLGKKQKQKVFVGLSGGVDSSVSAALLQKEGFDVTGVFIKVWQPDFLACTWPEDRLDAMRVCARLEIPLKTYDFSEEYKRDVVDYMSSEYKAGRTPNPDVMCNTRIKFDAFFHKAQEEGADYIATGHYVKRMEQDGRIVLHTAADTDKDQSYFLWGLSQEALERSLFPIGEFQKSTVRKMAARFRLPTAAKKDSQGLCFLGKLDMHDFLKHFVDEQPGTVYDEQGNAIGEHEGALFYTLGQRQGLRITGGDGKPYFVIEKDVEKNVLIVSADPSRAHLSANHQSTTLRNVNWTLGTPPARGEKLQARSRYRQKLFPCLIESVSKDTAVVSFEKEKPLTPEGQSLVLYQKSEGSSLLLGGGIIAA